MSVGGSQCEKLEEKLRKGLVTGRRKKFTNLVLFLVVMKFISGNTVHILFHSMLFYLW